MMAGWSDDEILQVMWRTDVLGQSAQQIALAFNTSRNAILGVIKRVRDAVFQLEGARLGDNDRLVILRRVLAGTEATVVAKDFACRHPGFSRMATLLLVHQILRETALAGPCAATLEDNRDANCWPEWWTVNVVNRGCAA